jgi:hypothetical protein
LGTLTICASCGADIEPVSAQSASMDESHCQRCNERFYAAIAAEYPHGQCEQCGAAGQLITCAKGKQHVIFWHSEGGCSRWTDHYFEDDGCDRCPPEIPVWRPDLEPEDLPF